MRTASHSRAVPEGQQEQGLDTPFVGPDLAAVSGGTAPSWLVCCDGVRGRGRALNPAGVTQA